jgi:hypothetical protein
MSILNVNPETGDPKEPYSLLYESARKHLCYRIWQSVPESASAAGAVFRGRKDGWAFENWIGPLIGDAWLDVAPHPQQMRPYIEADPSITERTRDGMYARPEAEEWTDKRMALANLEVWIQDGLWDYWARRFEGRRAVAVRVTEDGISLKGILPPDVMKMFYQPDQVDIHPSML